MKTKLPLGLAVGFCVLAGGAFFAGRYTAPPKCPEPTSTSTTEDNSSHEMQVMRSGGYKLINPLLDFDNATHSGLSSVTRMESEVNNVVQKILADRRATFVSVYYRDLNNGPWMGINEHENYSPASLLKVPIMIAALKKAETQPDFLKQKVKFEAPLVPASEDNPKAANMIKPGTTYTVEELVFQMAARSDEEAKLLVLKAIGDNTFSQVMKDLGVELKGVRTADDIMSVKDYSSFFRVLYNGTYLNKDMSEKALEILSQSDFKIGIVAGVPDGITVAHKFGERTIGGPGGKQLHDCGIVYSPNGPYLVCIMTRGNDYNALSAAIAEISKTVYTNAQAGLR